VLKIAVSKGTLLDGAIEFLKTNGISVETGDKRKLILNASPGLGFDKIEVLLVRGHDVPTYVEHGAVDLGVVGLDTVIDSKTNVMRLKDLAYGHCRLCVCGKKGLYKSLAELPNYTRVATTFPNITKDFFAKRGLEVEIINLYGSVELGPLTELSDIIVDLVASGKTLEENGLEVISEIMPCTAILIANEASFRVNKDKFLML
jgi:ATP phosphoribosyltransferase